MMGKIRNTLLRNNNDTFERTIKHILTCHRSCPRIPCACIPIYMYTVASITSTIIIVVIYASFVVRSRGGDTTS